MKHELNVDVCKIILKDILLAKNGQLDDKNIRMCATGFSGKF